MKENPQDKIIQNNLKPGEFSLKGFLGKDKRHFTEIVSADLITLDKLGITKEKIADRMQFFSDKAFDNFEGSVVIDEIFEIRYDTFRGKLVCPFVHSGVYRKGVITLKNLQKNLTVAWTPLNIHMIREHCFFEGINSLHRINPEDLIETIF